MMQKVEKGIVTLKNAYLDTEPICLEYEYIEGGDLTSLIRRMQKLPTEKRVEQARTIIRVLAETVGRMHRLSPPVIHRDLKPANVLARRTKEGRWTFLVADFGIGAIVAETQVLAERYGTTSKGDLLATMAHGSCTPLYASPQQKAGDQADPRDDVHALGVMWYQLLMGDPTKEPPLGGAWKKRFAEQGVPAEMIALLEQCFEHNPEDRPKDAAALADRISSLVPTPPTGPKPAGPSEGVSPPLVDLWHYLDASGVSRGPVLADELRRLHQGGQLTQASLIWKPGMPAWTPAGSVPGLLPVDQLLPPPADPGSGIISSSNKTAERFWQGLLSRPKVKTTLHTNITPGESQFIRASFGLRGVPFVYVIQQQRGRVELYINRGAGKEQENKYIFRYLHCQKEEIEKTFGGKLFWRRRQQKQAYRIAHLITLGGYESQESKWPAIQDAMIDAMIRLEKALIPHLDDLAIPQGKDKGPVNGGDKDGGTGKIPPLFGRFSVSSVIRWMGAHGWTYKDARPTLNHLKREMVSDGCINTCLYFGRKGQGKHAKLAPEHIAHLEAALRASGPGGKRWRELTGKGEVLTRLGKKGATLTMGAQRYQLFGYPVKRVLMWMGREGWSFQDARNALNNLALETVPDSSIRAQMYKGRNGWEGEPAALTEDQIKQLEVARGMVPGKGQARIGSSQTAPGIETIRQGQQEEITKIEAVRRALTALGPDAGPTAIQEYVKKQFDIDMTTGHISVTKSGLKQKGS